MLYSINVYLQNALLSGEQKQCNVMKKKGILDISRMSSIKTLYRVFLFHRTLEMSECFPTRV